MAEQEACAAMVEKASEEVTRQESKSSINGESLLPLLQGLLDQPPDDQPADSGTESGEDLRSGLIIEVQSALDKLSASLRSSTTNISDERRDSLLTLVSRLQAGLSTQITPSSSSERRSSLQGRFSKRKQRQNRHTVGVSTEELEDARKLMQEIAFNEDIDLTEPITIEGPELQKEDSTGSILSSTGSYKSQTKQVRNTTAKPFVNSSSTSQSVSGTSSTVETPTETSESIDFPNSRSPDVDLNKPKLVEPPNFNHSVSVDAYQAHQNKQRPLSEAVSLDYSQGVDLIKVQKAVTQAATVKQLSLVKSDISESDDDPSTIKQVKEPETIPQPKPDLIMQTNPVYSQPNESEEDDFVPNHYNEKANRFNTKKLKMKRANTIDIPKPLKYYEFDDDESENEELAQRRNSYLALRGPIRVGKLNAEKKVPEFQPKTESDRKFVAFLNKHNDDKTSKVAPWASQTNKRTFGNIKSTFEKFQSPAQNNNSARNFWKSADDAVTAKRPSQTGPKISKQSARNLQQMFEEKQRQNQYNNNNNQLNNNNQIKQYNNNQYINNQYITSSNNQKQYNGNQYNNDNVVTGSLKVDTKSLEGSKVIVTQPNQINQFSHAPMSAFKPVRKFEPIQPQPISNAPNISKVPLKTNDPSSPMYLYSPKPFSETPSPTNHAPWLGRTSESRVLSIAASKFENQVKEPQPSYGQRRLSKDRVHAGLQIQPGHQIHPIHQIPPGHQTHSGRQIHPGLQESQLVSPGIIKSLNQKTSVRKLSGQFENLKTEGDYEQPSRVFVPGKNYSIQYGSKPKVYNAEYTITQRINLPPVVEDNKDEYIKQHNQKQQLQLQKTPLERQKSIGGYQQEQPKVYKEPPSVKSDEQFTSNYQFQPKPKQEDEYISYSSSNKRRDSQDSLHEYTAVSSKVMRGPVYQQAVTVQNAPKSRDQHDFERAFNLKATLQKFNQLEQTGPRPLSTQSFKVKSTSNKLPQQNSMPEQSDVQKMVVYNNVGPKPVFCVNDKPLESLEINERGESVLTGKFSIPVSKGLSKSESWHQICQAKENLANKPSPRASPNSRTVTRSKSSHTLAIPKQYEAGMSKQEMLEKQKSLEAYFGGKKPTPEVKKTSINRVKTSQKISTQRQTSSSGLSRSKTLPDIVCLDRLDDSNIDEVFEEIFKQST